jgi:hypothetical protein
MMFAPAAVVEKAMQLRAAKTWLPVHRKTDSPFGWNQSSRSASWSAALRLAALMAIKVDDQPSTT